jgi:hypothetical protein
MKEAVELGPIKLPEPLTMMLLNLALWFLFGVLTLVLCAKV